MDNVKTPGLIGINGNPRVIGIIGAQGRFGRSLCRRLEHIHGRSVALIPSVDKSSNEAITKQSDVVMITVRSEQVEAVLKEIAPFLKPATEVVSFVAQYPLASIAKITRKASVRVMADPAWNMSAYLSRGIFLPEEFDLLLGKLTATKPLELRSDAEVETYTVLLAHLMVVLLLQRVNDPNMDNADEHLQFLAREFSKLGREFRAEEFAQYKHRTYPDVFCFEDLVTPGGITEKTLDVMIFRSADPDDVHYRMMKYFKLK